MKAKLPLESMDPNTSIKNLKYFKESDFHEVMGLTASIGTVKRDDLEGHGFRKGDRVVFPQMNIGTYREDWVRGVVSGIQGDYVRVGADLFAPERLRKL